MRVAHQSVHAIVLVRCYSVHHDRIHETVASIRLFPMPKHPTTTAMAPATAPAPRFSLFGRKHPASTVPAAPGSAVQEAGPVDRHLEDTEASKDVVKASEDDKSGLVDTEASKDAIKASVDETNETAAAKNQIEQVTTSTNQINETTASNEKSEVKKAPLKTLAHAKCFSNMLAMPRMFKKKGRKTVESGSGIGAVGAVGTVQESVGTVDADAVEAKSHVVSEMVHLVDLAPHVKAMASEGSKGDLEDTEASKDAIKASEGFEGDLEDTEASKDAIKASVDDKSGLVDADASKDDIKASVDETNETAAAKNQIEQVTTSANQINETTASNENSEVKQAPLKTLAHAKRFSNMLAMPRMFTRKERKVVETESGVGVVGSEVAIVVSVESDAAVGAEIALSSVESGAVEYDLSENAVPSAAETKEPETTESAVAVNAAHDAPAVIVEVVPETTASTQPINVIKETSLAKDLVVAEIEDIVASDPQIKVLATDASDVNEEPLKPLASSKRFLNFLSMPRLFTTKQKKVVESKTLAEEVVGEHAKDATTETVGNISQEIMTQTEDFSAGVDQASQASINLKEGSTQATIVGKEESTQAADLSTPKAQKRISNFSNMLSLPRRLMTKKTVETPVLVEETMKDDDVVEEMMTDNGDVVEEMMDDNQLVVVAPVEEAIPQIYGMATQASQDILKQDMAMQVSDDDKPPAASKRFSNILPSFLTKKNVEKTDEPSEMDAALAHVTEMRNDVMAEIVEIQKVTIETKDELVSDAKAANVEASKVATETKDELVSKAKAAHRRFILSFPHFGKKVVTPSETPGDVSSGKAPELSELNAAVEAAFETQVYVATETPIESTVESATFANEGSSQTLVDATKAEESTEPKMKAMEMFEMKTKAWMDSVSNGAQRITQTLSRRKTSAATPVNADIATAVEAGEVIEKSMGDDVDAAGVKVMHEAAVASEV